MKLYYTKHLERLKERNIRSEMVEKLLKSPEQVIEQENIRIAQGIVERSGKDFSSKSFLC